MDIGVVLQTTPPSARVVDLAKRAEAYGFTPRVDVRQPHPVAGAVRHLQPDPRRDPQHHRRADGHQPGHARLDRHGEHVRHAQRDVRQPHGVRHRPRRLGGAGHQRQADHDRHAARVGARHPRAGQRPQRRLQGLDDHVPVGGAQRARGVGRRLRAAGAGARRRGRRRLHPPARRPADRRRGRSAPCARRPSERRPRPRRRHDLRRRPGLRRRRRRPHARPVPLVRRHGRQPRRRHRRPLRRLVATCPAALTEYIKGRQGYDYNQHGQAGNTHADFVPDEIVDRFCILGPVDEQLRRLHELARPRRRPVRRLPPARRQGRHPAGLRRARHPGARRARLARRT